MEAGVAGVSGFGVSDMAASVHLHWYLCKSLPAARVPLPSAQQIRICLSNATNFPALAPYSGYTIAPRHAQGQLQ